ncbi:MAG: DUF4352 domain-containing protein [Chloroflexi bacterium]|nr:DUF4352 domain-containing protein [Chloroflexota bacterium]
MNLLTVGIFIGPLVLGALVYQVGSAEFAATTDRIARANSNLPTLERDRAPASARSTAAMALAAAPARLSSSGERVETAGMAVTVNGARKTSQLGQFLAPAAGKTYLVVEVTIETIARDRASHHPRHFTLRDRHGFEYLPTQIGDRQELSAGDLAAGETTRGTVTFEVPSVATGLVLSYEPFAFADGEASVRIALPDCETGTSANRPFSPPELDATVWAGCENERLGNRRHVSTTPPDAEPSSRHAP